MVYSILHILLLSRKMLPFWPGSMVVNDYATRVGMVREVMPHNESRKNTNVVTPAAMPLPSELPSWYP